MRIAASSLQSRVAHHAISRVDEREGLQSWQGDRPATVDADRATGDRRALAQRMIDRFERQPPASAEQTRSDDGPAIELSEEDETTLLILEKLFGAKGLRSRLEDLHFKLSSVSVEVTAVEEGQQRVGWGVAYDYSKDVYDAETTAVAFSGRVSTADGREIAFNIDMLMQREHRSHESFSLRAGDAALIDPIVLDLAGDGIAFSGRANFDLDADGSLDDLAGFAADDLLLALDRNCNGRLDDGSELFGPTTGDGYDELASYDEDGNGWIDEGDSIFAQLHLGSLNGDLGTSLTEAGIGALHLGRTLSPFSHKAGDGVTDIAQTRATSLYLREDGRAGLSQQVDLVA